MQDIRKAVDGPQVKDACIGIKRIRPHTTDAWVKKARVLLRDGLPLCMAALVQRPSEAGKGSAQNRAQALDLTTRSSVTQATAPLPAPRL